MSPLSCLRDDLVVSPQKSSSGAVRMIIHHPVTGKTYAFSELSWKILGTIGQTPTLAAAVVAATGTTDPTPEMMASIERLVEQATSAGLLAEPGVQPPVQTAEPVRTGFNPFFVRLPLPGVLPLLARIRPVSILLFSRFALGMWTLFLLSAIVLIGGNTHPLLKELGHLRLLAPWLQLYWLLAAATCVHELGHALACERFGIRVKELGLLLYLFQPGAYADVSETWLLPKRSERIIVTLGGMYFETVLFATAVWVWWKTLGPAQVPSHSIHATALIFALLLMSRITLNLVPFLRLDGYLVLVDLLDMPNLRRRSFAYGRWLLSGQHRTAQLEYGPKSTRERIVYVFYALLATIFTFATLISVAAGLLRTCIQFSPHYGLAIFTSLIVILLLVSIPFLRQTGVQYLEGQTKYVGVRR